MKTLVTIIALSAATVFSAQAQDTQRANKSAVKTVQEQPQQNPSEQAKDLTNRMALDLGLDADQSKKLMDRNKSYFTAVADANKKDVAERSAMMQKAADKYDGEIKRILNENQYAKYATMKEDYLMSMKTNQMETVPANKDMQRK